MFKVNEDLSIYVTRGDIVTLSVTAEDNGEAYVFQPGDLVRIKVFGKKDCETVVLQKDFPITSASEEVEIFLDERDTKIGGVISKPVDYWYEVELNPLSAPQTIIGYGEDGPAVFRLFPEGRDLEEYEYTEEDIPFVDDELDLSSTKPVENQAIARAVEQIKGNIKKIEEEAKDTNSNVAAHIEGIEHEIAVERYRIDSFVALNDGSTTGDAELQDIRVGADGVTYASAGTAVRNQLDKIKPLLKDKVKYITDDLDLYYGVCFYGVCASTILNAPIEEVGLIDVQTFSTGATTWTVQKWRGDKSQASFVRTYVLGKWSDWKSDNVSSVNFITTDLDEYTKGDMRAVVVGATNVPESGTGFLDVIEYATSSNVWTLQVWHGASSGNVYYRMYIAVNGWSEWYNTTADKHFLAGKKIVFLGDSIFGNNRTDTGVVNLFANCTGTECINGAFGGTRAKKRTSADGWEHFDGESIAKAIVSGDFSGQIAALDYTPSVPSSFPGIINLLAQCDFSTVDYIICNYGTNDWTAGNTKETYKEGMKNIIKTILTAYPHIVFIKCTPTQRYTKAGTSLVSGNDYKISASGLTLQEFTEADAELGKDTNIQIIDLYNIGINDYTKDNFFDSTDYVHQNALGRKRIAECLSKAVF